MIKIINKEDDFLKVISNGTCLVDFYADWCGPCKRMLPILEQVDFIDIYKVNVDECEELARKYGIMSIPSLLIFKDGELVRKEIGLKTLDEIKGIVESL